MKFSLYTKPVIANRRLQHYKGLSFTPKLWKDTKYALAQETRLKWQNEPHSTPLAVHLHFFFGDNRKRDIDAYIKIILDSMEGIVYENDFLINELHCYKSYDKENPRTEVEIKP